ncbi:MAG: hypothetical protein B7X06_02205, partial [Verrucomicrobia bacterium 21-51-4]
MRLSYETALAHLESLRVYSGLSRPSQIGKLLEFLGQPERSLRCIHIAGTNGKGSVAAMLESIYRHAGYRVGLYTSPHLVDWVERIQINRQCTSPEAFATVCEEVFNAVQRAQAKHWGLYFTPFELLTACACVYFSRQQVDLAIIETGIGGRLDPTNYLGKLLAVITSIGLDHESLLGPDLAHIAAEKAAIIAPQIPVVVGQLEPQPYAVVCGYAWANAALLYSVEDVFGLDKDAYPNVSLEGDHQRINAGSATLAVRALQEWFPVEQAAIHQGLMATHWAGRWQRLALEDGKELILEAAHNAQGAIYLEQLIQLEIKQRGTRPHICVGFLGESRAQAILAAVAPYAQSISCIDMGPQGLSARDCADMAQCIAKPIPINIIEVNDLFV